MYPVVGRLPLPLPLPLTLRVKPTVYPVVGRALEALDHRHGLIRGRGSRGRGRG